MRATAGSVLERAMVLRDHSVWFANAGAVGRTVEHLKVAVE